MRRFLFLFVAAALAGAPALLTAQESLTFRDGRKQDGKIVGVANGTVEMEIKLPNGSDGKIGFPVASLASVTMDQPAAVRAGLAAYEAGDFAKALAELRGPSEKFRGLPVEWARRLAAVMGDVYLETKDLAKAEAAYAEFGRLYPGGKASLRSNVGIARLATAKGDRARARQLLDPIAKAALEDAAPSDADAALYGQVFFLLGQAREADKDYTNALQDYLRAVTLFYQDRGVAAAAQKAADALRAAQKTQAP